MKSLIPVSVVLMLSAVCALAALPKPGRYVGSLSSKTSLPDVNLATGTKQKIVARVAADGTVYVLSSGASGDFGAFEAPFALECKLNQDGTTALFGGQNRPVQSTSRSLKMTYVLHDTLTGVGGTSDTPIEREIVVSLTRSAP